MQEAMYNAMPITPSSVCSYPTYTPPPPPPTKRREENCTQNTDASPTRRRTFPEECDEVLRVIYEDSTHSPIHPTTTTAAGVDVDVDVGGVDASSILSNNNNNNNKSNNNSNSNNKSYGFTLPSTTHEKYRAILSEVEHLNRLLEVTVEERDDVENELRGKLMQAQIALRDREAILLQKENELLHLRGAVEGLTIKLEAYKHQTHSDEKDTIHVKETRNYESSNNNNNNNNDKKKNYDNNNNNIYNGSSSSSIKSRKIGEPDITKRNSSIRAEIVTTSERVCRSSRSNSNSMEVAAVDIVTYSSSNNNSNNNNTNNNNSNDANATSSRLAQSALKWVKFLLGRYFPNSSNKDNEKLSNLLNILNNLQEYSKKIDVDASLVRSLCTQASNALVEVVKIAASTSQSSDHTRVSSGVVQTVSNREDLIQERVLNLEKERDTLKEKLHIVTGENVQLLHQIKALENGSPQWCVSLPARVDRLEVQNAMLLAERDRQSAFIVELKQQVQRLKMERTALLEKLVK